MMEHDNNLVTHNSSNLDGHCTMPVEKRPVRFQCRLYQGNYRKIVYLDIDDHGKEKFWQEEDGDVQLHPFKPSAQEEEALRRFFDEDPDSERERRYVDLDVEPGVLMATERLKLASFRSFVYKRYGELFAIELDRKILEFLKTRQTCELSAERQ
jgi:hypothetical protein